MPDIENFSITFLHRFFFFFFKDFYVNAESSERSIQSK